MNIQNYIQSHAFEYQDFAVRIMVVLAVGFIVYSVLFGLRL